MFEPSLYVYPPIDDTQFPFYLDKQSYSEKGETFRAHWHEHFELIFVERGTIGLICNGNEMSASEGDLLVLNPQDVHHLHSLTEQVDYYCLVFDLALLKTELSDRVNSEFLQPLYHRQIMFDNKILLTRELTHCCQALITEQDRQDIAYELMIKSYLNQLIALLIRTKKYTRLNQAQGRSRKKNQALIREVLTYLNHHYENDVVLSDLAGQFSVSQHHLCHLFKHYTNRSIIQYLNRLRIEKAMGLLLQGNQNITEVAYTVGFNDANYFSRTFKKLTSVTPRQWVSENQALECSL